MFDRKKSKKIRPTVVDLFSGCGGLYSGFSQMGFKNLLSVDNWEAAIRTYKKNYDHPILQASIDENIILPDSDIIIGGPPCQGFSSAGLRKTHDERNTLVSTFANIVAKKLPKAFVFENVEGFLTTDQGRYVHDLIQPLIKAGYVIHVRKINAANYGSGQLRKRVIVIGGLGWKPNFPEYTHSTFGAPGASLANNHFLPNSPTFFERTGDLPLAQPYNRKNDEPFDHTFVPFKATDEARAKLLEQGQCMRDLPEEHWHDSYARRANRRVRDGTPTEKRGGAPAGLRRLRNNEPSKAITGGALREFIHPNKNRPLTIRECARLQDFSDDFYFTGNRSEKIQQIGNAVPVSLSRALARSILLDIGREHHEEKGGIASFIPTLSTGMSPALTKITNEITTRYPFIGKKEMDMLCL